MLNRESLIPYYIQIYNYLKDRIEKGIYKVNDLIPSENELVEEFHVTRVTVRNAIKKLKDEGHIYTEKGKGSFVNQPKIVQNLYKFYSFGRDYKDERFNTETILISSTIIECNAVMQKNLNLDEGAQVIETKRLRKMEGIPFVLETSYVPVDILPKFRLGDFDQESIYDVLEKKFNIKLSKAMEYLDPCIADQYYSKMLMIEEGTPLYLTERVTYTINEVPIEFRRTAIRSDKFRFSVELR